MGGNYLGNAGHFLIETLFGLYILTVMLRFLLQLVRADFYNPVSQFLVKVTNPPLIPLRKIIPGIGGIDWASVLLMFGLKLGELVLRGLLPKSSIPPMPGIFVIASAGLLSLLVNVFLFSILIQVVISWISPGGYNPMVGLLQQLTEPLLRPARRLIPPISGLDLSPMAVIIVLYLILMLVVQPIHDLGVHMAFYATPQ
ncbi:MAG: YggT family protein [Gammaproteobacteria bacterium]|nr:YggT family protein [Gammaproteobacteria bacterium]MDH5650416.1 YggT family protein [Gammaproteobacteria bacterium]